MAADIHQFPRGARVDVRNALLNNQKEPEVRQPRQLQAAIDKRARELAEEAYLICREHLQRRVAYNAEFNRPRELDMNRAHKVLQEGDLGDALTRVYREKIEGILACARVASTVSGQFDALIAELTEITGRKQ